MAAERSNEISISTRLNKEKKLLTPDPELNSAFSNCCLLCLFLRPEGVYAWIGINFVLGRFDHAEEGECVRQCVGFTLGSVFATYSELLLTFLR